MPATFNGTLRLSLLFLGGILTTSAANAPFVYTCQARPITTTNATLAGMVVANGSPTSVWFEWGTNTSYGQTSVATNIGSGDSVVYLTERLTPLSAAEAWHYRVVASNALGTAYGSDRLFRTGRRIVTWGIYLDYPSNSPANIGDITGLASAASEMVLRQDGQLTAWSQYFSNQVSVPNGLTNIIQVAGEWATHVALRSDGTVTAWSVNAYGPSNAPAGLSNVIAIACGPSHALALRKDGVVLGWGGPYSDTLASVPAGLSNVVAIDAGGGQSLALKADGTVVVWGALTNAPAGLSNVIAVAAGDDHCLALRADGNVVAWGDNYYGVTNVPAAASNVIAIACRKYFDIALRSDGSLVPWGQRAFYSAYGNYLYFGYADVPAGLSNVVDLAVGDDHALALLANRRPRATNQVVACPANQDFVLALNGVDDDGDLLSFRITSFPVAGQLYQYVNGARGAAITLTDALVSDGNRRLIFAPSTDFSGPVQFEFRCSDGDWNSPDALVTLNVVGSPYANTQPAHMVAGDTVSLNGSVVPNGFPTTAWFEWGTNAGYGFASAPVAVGQGSALLHISEILSNITPDSVVQFRLVASNQAGPTLGAKQQLCTGRKVTVWGSNNYGQLNVPPDLTNAVAISGFNHHLALKSGGKVAAWGNSDFGQAAVPFGLSNAIAIATGDHHSLALTANGTVRAWGLNGDKQATVPADLSNVVAIAAGSSHNLALRQDGSVITWGANVYGETNVPPGLSNVVSIAGGYGRSLALRADGTVLAWGYLASNWVPTDLSGVVAIRQGLALKSDGTVAKLGPGTDPPVGLSNVIAIADSTALRADGTVVSWSTTPPPPGLSNVVATEANFAIGPNQPPVAKPLNPVGPANSDLVVTLQGTDSNGDGLNFQVVNLPPAGTVFQFDNGVRGPQITTADTAVSDPLGRIIFVPEMNGFGSPYTSFDYLATDGSLDSASATVQVRIYGEPKAVTHTAAPAGRGNVLLRGMAAPNGFASLAWFDWATNGGSWQATSVQFLTGTPQPQTVTAIISNLPPIGSYRFRLAVSNEMGQSVGADLPFTPRGVVATFGSGYLGDVFGSGTPLPIPTLDRATAISLGGGHALALNRDGRVTAFLVHTAGQTSATNVPANGTNVVAVAAGSSHSLALRDDGRVLAWGSSSFGQAIVPSLLDNVISVAAGGTFSLALRSNGTLVAWGGGFPNYGQAVVPAGLSNVVQIAAGTAHGLALRSDGALAAWGDNSSGQTNIPPGLSNVVSIAAGGNNSLVVLGNGRIVTWGSNSGGQTNVPAGATNVVATSVGGTHTLALKSDGSVVGWGNAPGAVVPSNLTAVAVSAWSYFSLVLSPLQELRPYAHTQPARQVSLAGALLTGAASPRDEPAVAWFEWGRVGSYDLATSPQLLPATNALVRVNALVTNLEANRTYQSRLVVSNVMGVARGGAQFFVTGGRVAEWGQTNGGLALPPRGLSNVIAAAAGTYHTLALRDDGRVVAWGIGNFGPTNVPPSLTNAVAVGAGENLSVALKSDGRVTAWGWNSSSQTNVPANLTNVVALAVGRYHSLALRADNTVTAWGDNSSGKTNVPAGLGEVVALAAGATLNLALKPDGQVVAWGSSLYTNVPSSASNVAALACGSSHALVLRKDGSVVAWGQNNYGQTNVPASATNIVAIAAAADHSLALREDGMVVAWGLSTSGRTTIPGGLTNVAFLAGGDAFSLALGENSLPQTLDRTNSGAANTDFIVGLSAADANNDLLTLRLVNPPLAGRLYQYTNGSRGAVLVADTVVTDAGRRVIFAPAANEYGNPYVSFTFTASDGEAISPTGRLTLNISAPQAPTITKALLGTNGGFQIEFQGHTRTTYCVWASTNLVDWEYLGFPTQPTAGKFSYFDNTTPDLPQRFYRISTGCGSPAPELSRDSTLTNGKFALGFTGGAYWTYRVFASTNLVNWEFLGTANESSAGKFNFLDEGATNLPQRFYKAVAP